MNALNRFILFATSHIGIEMAISFLYTYITLELRIHNNDFLTVSSLELNF